MLGERGGGVREREKQTDQQTEMDVEKEGGERERGAEERELVSCIGV